ncbi:MAG: metallophosphoesterase [Erysipelotrichaceae bacterium]|jgi:predicted MPP superfamily phosphohydrolase
MKRKMRLSLVLLILVFLAIWTVWGNLTVGVTHYGVGSSRIPESFDNFKIAVISDLHNAEFGKDNENIVRKVSQQSPNIIVFTGDLVDSNKTDIDLAVSLAKQLMEIAPCYFVMGNHEVWLFSRYEELQQKLIDVGVIVLRNEVIEITRNEETIQIAGLDDPDLYYTDIYMHSIILDEHIKKMNLTDDYCILLSHRPEAFDIYVANDIDLVLSGHAHGGQIRIPFLGGFYAPNQGMWPKYDAGKFTENFTTMIVSRGIGNSIIPIRINNRPEIIIVELVCNK